MNVPIRARGRALGILAVAGMSLGALPALAQSPTLSVELNKLEAQGAGCRAYVVVENTTDATYDAFKLDIVLFKSDGVIGRRFAMDLGPVKPKKRSVKLYDFEYKCEEIGSFLINDVMECKGAAGPIEDCLAGVTVKSLTKAELSK